MSYLPVMIIVADEYSFYLEDGNTCEKGSTLVYFLILYYIAKIQQAFTPLTAHGSKDPEHMLYPESQSVGSFWIL